MRRLAVTALILVAAAVAAGTAAGAPLRVPLLAKPKTTVKVKVCSIEDHRAVFYARMRKLRGTRRMRMRFTLLERPAGGRSFRRVRAPGLSRWRKSAPGVRSYGYSQEVLGLRDGSTYRMRVRYRWYDDEGDIQRGTRRTSRACRMFDPLPNLRVRVVEPRFIAPYKVQVRNAGTAAADNVAVQLAVDCCAVTTQTISRLEPGEARHLDFNNGPVCKRRYRFQVDPGDAIPEANETDNTATVSCLTR